MITILEILRVIFIVLNRKICAVLITRMNKN